MILVGQRVPTGKDLTLKSFQDNLDETLRLIRQELPAMEQRPAIAGVGNEMRADDAFGVMVARELEGKVSVPVYDTGPVPENFLGKIARSGARSVLILDAVDFGGEVGEIRLLDPEETTYSHFSSHLPPLQLVKLFYQEGGIDVKIIAVQPGDVRLMEGVSGPVQAAYKAVSRMLVDAYGVDAESG